MGSYADVVSLNFENGQADITGVEAVNRVLNEIGVNITPHEIPQAVKPILTKSS